MRVIAAVPIVLAALNTVSASHVPGTGSSLDHHNMAKRSDLSVSSTDVELEKRTLGLLCGLPLVSSILCGSSSSKYPSKTWNCNGGGGDGWDYDYNGKTRPSTYPSGWKYFGVSYGWGPPKGWSCSDSWSPPSGVTWSRFNWWAPQLTWRVPTVGFVFPSLWLNFGWKLGSNGHYGYPSSSWTCSGAGNDGWDYDHNGNGRPSNIPSGWLWFGSSIGWGPHSSWSVPSKSWSIPSGISLGLFRWWVPSYGSWNCPSGYQIPSWWYNKGWPTVTVTVTQAPSTTKPTPQPTPTPVPSNDCHVADWQTNGEGHDGCDTDYNGSHVPSCYPSDWLYWGSDFTYNNGWGPCAGWVPEAGWEAPYDMSPYTWWSWPARKLRARTIA